MNIPFIVDINPDYANADQGALLEHVREFLYEVDGVYEYHLATISGFNLHCKNFSDNDDGAIFFGKDDPNNRPKIFHHTTKREMKARISARGSSRIRVAQTLIMWVDLLWDDKYRKRISKVLDCDSVKDDYMGALNALRNDIVHNKGCVGNRPNKLAMIKNIEIFSHLNPEDRIVFLDEAVYELVRWVKMSMDRIIISAGGKDHKFRIINYLE